MEVLVKTDFKKQLDQLAESIGTPTTIPTLPEFQTKAKGWGWIGAEHKVSGAEMNSFIEVLDKLLIEKKQWETKAYQEIKSIYDTLDALDKEYINGFIGTFEAVKKESNDSTQAILILRKAITAIHTELKKKVSTSNYKKELNKKADLSALCQYVKSDDPRLTDARPASDVHDWAKAKDKPSYTAEEVHALSDSTKIPTKTSELENDKGFLTEHQDISGKQDVIADLDSIRNGAALGATAIQEHQDISGKQDVIADLDTIRSGAALGATAIQEHQDISGKQDVIADLDTIRSGAALGATAIQEHQDISSKQDVIADLDTIRSGAALGATAIQEHQDISGKQDVIADLDTIRSGAALGATAIQEHQDISGKQDVIADLDRIRNGAALGATAIQEHQDISGKADTSYVDNVKNDINQEIKSLKDALQTSQTKLNNAQQGHIKLKRALITTSICTGTVSIAALITLLILIL